MYDFLKETTYDGDDLLDGGLLDSILSGLSRSKPVQEEPEDTGLPEVSDDEVDADSEEAANEPEQEDTPEQPEFGFDDDMTESDLAIIDSMFNGTLGGSREQAPTGNSNLGWLNTKTDNVNISQLNPSISSYLNTLPADIRASLVATSGNDDRHARGSKHYHNNAVDLRFNDKAWNYMQNDPNFKKYGLKTLNPNHGTAKHIHLETMKYGGQSKYIIDHSKLCY